MPEATVSISPDLQEALSKQIGAAVANIPEAMGPSGIKGEFCNVWPAARGGLEALRTVLNFVPGVNVFAGPAISIVLAAGDAAKSAICE